MFGRRRHKALKRASWLALFAILFQALLPLAHHPAAMAAPAGFDSAHNLCLAPGSTAPSDPAKAPAHHMPDCALCAAMHAIGGFVPPMAPAIAVSRDYVIATPVFALILLPRQSSRPRQQPRAPPLPV
jgi:hypothetical protein